MTKKVKKAGVKWELTSRNLKWINGGCELLFVAFTFLFLAVYKGDFLFRMQELSIFLPIQKFFTDFMYLPGGMLQYLGCFLTQFCYYPWLGAFFLVVLWVAIQYFTYKAFDIPSKYFVLSFIPSALLFISVTQLDYLMYSFRSPGYLYSQTIGFLIVSILFWIYKSLSDYRIKAACIFVFIIGFYPLIGFYALLFAFFVLSYELIHFKWTKEKYRLGLVTLALLLGLIIPLFYYYRVYEHLNIEYLYSSGLPIFDLRAGFIVWIPFIGLVLFPVIAFLFFSNKKKISDTISSRSVVINALMCLVIIACAYSFSNRDYNFKRELTMERALNERDWVKMLEIAKDPKETPTRMIVMFRNLALFKQGQLSNKMFSYPDGDKRPNSRFPVIMVQMGGKPLYYHYGKLNYCYRWCMEDMVEYGLKVEYLQYMIKIALINGEPELAQKYLKTLSQTLFYKDWAKKYQAYVDDPKLMAQDVEFKEILPLLKYKNVLGEDDSVVELYLMNSLAYLQSGTPSMLELSLASNLVMKNIAPFWPRLFQYANITRGKLPSHFQEAALLYSYLERKVDVSQMGLDPFIINRFYQFTKMIETYKNVSEEELEPMFRSSFGDTYWYYYFFVTNIKTK